MFPSSADEEHRTSNTEHPTSKWKKPLTLLPPAYRGEGTRNDRDHHEQFDQSERAETVTGGAEHGPDSLVRRISPSDDLLRRVPRLLRQYHTRPGIPEAIRSRWYRRRPDAYRATPADLPSPSRGEGRGWP